MSVGQHLPLATKEMYMDRDAYEVLKKIEQHQDLIRTHLATIAAALENIAELLLRQQQK